MRSAGRTCSAGSRSNEPHPPLGRSAMTTTTFDPVAYKRTTRAQWEQAAEAWDRWEPTLEAWLGQATEVFLGLAAVTEAWRIFDAAAAAAGQTIAAARVAGRTGHVLA